MTASSAGMNEHEATGVEDLPIDPTRGTTTGTPFAGATRSAWPRLRPDVVAVVFLGGCLGGWARYVVGEAWTAPARGFPTAILTVNLAGAFILSVVVVLTTGVRPSRYVRPLLGTGFCGALTTFSAVVVSTAQLLGHGRTLTALGYLAATVIGGLAAASLGLVTGRAIGRPAREERNA